MTVSYLEKSAKISAIDIVRVAFVFVVVSAIAACGGGGGGGDDEPDPVPAEFTALYDELSTNLAARERELLAVWDGTRSSVTFSTTLLTASSNLGAALFDPAAREGNRVYLGRLAEFGVGAVVLQINYPILTSDFTAAAPNYLATYAEIADEIRALGLKVIVEHNNLIPTFSALDPTTYYANLTKTRFGQESYAEVRAIVEQIQPDYLTLVSEPGTFEWFMGLQMSVTDWSAYVDGTINQLAIDVPGHTTRLGAGSGAWEDPAFVTAFAGIVGLDYIDIHSYPLTNGITDYLRRLEEWPELVRSFNPSLEVMLSEGWLYKAQASELGGPPVDPDLLVRDVYSFWEPLDAQFLEVLAITAHHSDYAVIAPFWSNYFFAYLDYDDPSLSGLTSTELYDRAFAEAFQAAQAGRTTGLAQVYKQIIAP